MKRSGRVWGVSLAVFLIAACGIDARTTSVDEEPLTPDGGATPPCPPGFERCDAVCIRADECCGGCPEGQRCEAGQCLVSNGVACVPGVTACASGNCSAGRCCPESCGAGGCSPEGSCACPNGEQFARGACRGSDGQPCATNDDCASGCTDWYEDLDEDGFGAPDGPVRLFCGTQQPAVGVALASNDDDCCDGDARVRPGQLESFPDFLESLCPADWKSHDFDCDDVLRYRDGMSESDWSGTTCEDSADPARAATPCSARSGVVPGAFADAFGPVFDANGDAALCGNSSIQWIICQPIDGACDGHMQLAPPCN